MKDAERDFHETWLGMVQPSEGLLVSLPVLAEAQCFERQPPQVQRTLLEASTSVKLGEPKREVFCIKELPQFLETLLGLSPDLWDAAKGYRTELGWAGQIPEALSYYAPEGPQTIKPTLALRKLETSESAEESEAVRAGAAYELLLWEIPAELDLGKAETTTGAWDYPAAAKFERLLRAAKVPIGILTNRRVVRLVYAPHGEATGSIDFRLSDMLTVGGRPILDALVMLLHAKRFFSVAQEHALPSILADSRERQADVTTQLGAQVLEALTVLLRGFEAAADRDGRALLEDALARENDHLYRGLLTVLLRIVFVLFAEDRELLPVEHPLYRDHYSLFALYQRLLAEHGERPDSMSRRYGAWGQLVALFRAIYQGAKHGDFEMPARRGTLFNPNAFAFLEGWDPEGTAPLYEPELRAGVKLPTLDDETVFLVLQRLIVVDGQRLSYRSLDVEQIGSVYEGLMGYHVERVAGPAVQMKPDGVWLCAEEVLAEPPARRAAFLAERVNLAKAQAQKLAESLKGARAEAALEVLQEYALGRTKAERAKAQARAGQLVLQPGVERRRTSSHYTPRSLSSKVVDRTLEPLLRCMTKEGEAGPASQQILELRICDLAMGSGAFLVEACRYLGDALVDAWAREGQLSHYHDPVTAARRRVAQCCLYGVDKNAAAVELGKLSLWLVTLAKHRPFTFLDGNLRHGDSLVGLDKEQLRAFHWKPAKQAAFAELSIDKALQEAIDARAELRAMAHKENGINPDPKKKERLHRDAEDAIAKLKLIGDVCIGAFFAEGSDKAREAERLRRRDLVDKWLESEGKAAERLEAELRELQAELRKTQVPFHWMLEFPDVFWDERADPLEAGAKNGAAFIDAFVGNPPFSGKNGITEAGGPHYLLWLQAVHEGAHGNADLSAHFFRRTERMLGRRGTIGLIATNTIGQGDTRATGLQFLAEQGLQIYDATTNMPWPGNTAAVTVSIIHLAKHMPSVPKPVLDGIRCEAINSQLGRGEDREDPSKLNANAGRSFVGTYVLGMGFTLTPEERKQLIAKNRRNAERIFPYLGGEEVNTSPEQAFDRYVISFGQMNLEEAERWPDLLAIVREKVKAERDKLKDNADGRRRKEYWWQFGRWTPALYQAIAPLSRCLVTARVTKHLCFSFQSTDRILNEKLYVFPFDNYAPFAVLQSRVHVPWAWAYSSTMKTDLNYSASDCFETFPFPKPDPRSALPKLEKLGEQLYEARAKYMLDTQQGLTKTYNALKDPSCTDRRILALREQHEALDAAVLAEYGWSKVKVPPFCAKTEADIRAQERFKTEVIDLLYELNAERAEEEALRGLGAKKGKAPAVAKIRPAAAAPQVAANDNGKRGERIKGPASTRPKNKDSKRAEGGRR